MKRRQNGEILSPAAKTCRMIWTVILIIYTFITVFVIAMTLMDSLKTKGDLVSNFVGIPKAVSFESYKKILLEDNFLLYFKNSFLRYGGGHTSCGSDRLRNCQISVQREILSHGLFPDWNDGAGSGEYTAFVSHLKKDWSD